MSSTQKLRNPNSNTMTMMDSYFVGNSGAVKRIGNPHEHDVLSGRGGAINSHPGNAKFREWVRERKNRYNLARTKAEKASVANEVMDLVRNQNPPGRFLQRDQSSVTGGVTWWVEVDEVKAMAKTSQALREGAPSIRAAHKDELSVRKRKRSGKKGSSGAAQTPITTGSEQHSYQSTQPPPLQPSDSMTLVPATMSPALAVTVLSPTQAMEQLKANVEAARHNEPAPSYSMPPLTSTPASYEVPVVKRSRLSENLYLPMSSSHHHHLPQPHIVKPDDETPPLAPLPSPIPLDSIPELGDTFPMPAPTVPKREASLRRANSLALSDIGSGSDNWGELEFVNPFEGDTSEEISTMPPPEGVRSRNSLSNMSVKSELSDLCDVNAFPSVGGMADSEFGEGMKDVYDAVHPGLDSSGDNEPIPTHLYPYRGSFDLTKASDSPQLIY